MKLLHLSDLHIGMRLREFSLLEDQSYILTEILGIVRREAPDGVILAGDLYDKAAPSAEAVALLDRFLTELCEPKGCRYWPSAAITIPPSASPSAAASCRAAGSTSPRCMTER